MRLPHARLFLKYFALLGVLVAFAMATGFDVRAQQPGRAYRVAITGPEFVQRLKGISDRLARHGFIVGRNVVIFTSNSESAEDELVAEARGLIEKSPDVIMAEGTLRTRILQSLTKEVPIVFSSADPLAGGLVTNLARPGRNSTGVSTQACKLIEKRRELIAELAPKAGHVVLIRASPLMKPDLCQDVMDTLKGVPVLWMQPTGGERAAKANLAVVLRANPDAVISFSAYPGRDEILTTLAQRRRVPIVSDDSVDQPGVLGGIETDQEEGADLLVDQVAKILNGASPGSLPVVFHTRFRMEINLRLAKEVGIQVPESIILRADRVVR